MAYQYLKEEDQPKVQDFNPSEKYIETVNRVYERFTAMRDDRNKRRREFDYRTLDEYVKDSMDAYNGIVSDEVRNSKEDWQSLMWDHETRGKVKAIISMVIAARPFVTLLGETDEDHKFSHDLFRVYEDTWRKENGSYQLYLQALSATNKGTVIVEETYREEKRKIKEISNIDHETGQITSEEKDIIVGGYGHVKSNIVPILDFYPNENSPEIEHDCCVVKLFSRKAFLNKYGKYPHAQMVTAGRYASENDDIEYEAVTQNKDELIEVIRYYNEDYDEFIILANGFWINPQKGDSIAPIPFDHHRLPFRKTVFELADENLFYGKSFPDILGGEQETRNALQRLMIDQEILAANKPIMIGEGFEIDSHELYPGKQMRIGGDIRQIREMPFTGASQSAMLLLRTLKTNANENSAIDSISQGVAGGGRKTAREAVILDENAKRISGTFQLFIYKLIKERAELRIQNIQQFYTQPIQYNVLKDKYGNVKKKTPVMRTVPIAQQGQEPRWITMTPEMRRANLSVWLIEDYELPMNKSTRIELSRALLDEAKGNPLISADEATIEYLTNIGKDPNKFYIKPQPQAQQFQQQQQQQNLIPPNLPPQNV